MRTATTTTTTTTMAITRKAMATSLIWAGYSTTSSETQSMLSYFLRSAYDIHHHHYHYGDHKEGYGHVTHLGGLLYHIVWNTKYVILLSTFSLWYPPPPLPLWRSPGRLLPRHSSWRATLPHRLKHKVCDFTLNSRLSVNDNHHHHQIIVWNTKCGLKFNPSVA